MPKAAQKLTMNHRIISVFVLAILLSWVLAFPFEGQILYAIAWHHKINIRWITMACFFIYCAGTLMSGFLIKNGKMVKQLFTCTLILCIISCFVFFLQPSVLWYLFLMLTIFLAGCSFAGWGLYYADFTPANDRMRTAADVLIYNNIGMLIIGLIVYRFTYVAGLVLMLVLMFAALYMILMLPEELVKKDRSSQKEDYYHNLRKAVHFLFLFIFVVTINTGIAFYVLLPSFSHLGIIVNFYWSFPYVLSMVVIRSLPRRFNLNYLLYVAIAMMGFAYMGYMELDHSLVSFIVICSIIFIARGIFDLFWWSIIGEMLDLSRYPIQVMGGGVASHVFGFMAGGFVGKFVHMMRYDRVEFALLALAIVFTALLLMPPLHNKLTGILKNHIYLNHLSELPVTEQKEIIKCVTLIDKLTERESEIAALLMQGRTYKMISSELFLSENTVKTQIKNIYSKLHVKNKTELINILVEQKPEVMIE